MTLKHNLKGAIELMDTDPAFVPQYLDEWKEELEHLKRECDTQVWTIHEWVAEVLGT